MWLQDATVRVATQASKGTGRQRRGSSAASLREIIPIAPFKGSQYWPHPHQYALQREILDAYPHSPPPKSIPRSIFRSGSCVCIQGEVGKSWGGIQTPAGLICLVSHSPQLSFPQHLDTVKHLADPDKIRQAFAAGFGRNPQWILAQFKAVRFELGLVKKGDASCNPRLPLTSI